MAFEGSWHPAVILRDTGGHYRLKPEDDARLPALPAVYVFGRRYGDNATPLYIGQSLNLRRRVLKQHFDSLRFLNALRGFPQGDRFLLWCTFELKTKQKISNILGIVERGLIDKALTEGHQLINIRGVRTPAHLCKFTGNRISEQIAGREMLVRKRWIGF